MIILLVIFILQIPQLLNNFIQILIFFIDKNYFAFVLLYHFFFFQSLGCAIYTGPDTKMALNSKAKINKFSRVERYCIVIIDSYII